MKKKVIYKDSGFYHVKIYKDNKIISMLSFLASQVTLKELLEL